jgi:hypothetical protein
VLSFLHGALETAGARSGYGNGNDLFKQDEGYIEWPDANVPGSVVYISFSSLSVMSTRQM